jgi:hypothetical protein
MLLRRQRVTGSEKFARAGAKEKKTPARARFGCWKSYFISPSFRAIAALQALLKSALFSGLKPPSAVLNPVLRAILSVSRWESVLIHVSQLTPA